MNKLDLTVIIPVHSVIDPEFRSLLDSALTSIQNNSVHPEKVLIVRCPCDDVFQELKTMDLEKYDLNVEVVENTTGKALQNQVNYGVSQVKTKYFSFLEFDDEYSINWFKNVELYVANNPGIKMFLPIISDVDHTGTFMGYTNEAAWAKEFTEKMGYLDEEALLRFPNFNLGGMVVDVETWKAVGGYKPSIKLTFNYELLLRFLNKGKQVMVIPKIGYKHVNMRPGGLFWDYKNSEDKKLAPDEAAFWMEVATKEYFFTEDRNVTYTK
jgi:hypothetical protein